MELGLPEIDLTLSITQRRHFQPPLWSARSGDFRDEFSKARRGRRWYAFFFLGSFTLFLAALALLLRLAILYFLYRCKRYFFRWCGLKFFWKITLVENIETNQSYLSIKFQLKLKREINSTRQERNEKKFEKRYFFNFFFYKLYNKGIWLVVENSSQSERVTSNHPINDF